MLKIHLPRDVRAAILDACLRSGTRETGGMLLGEHLADENFRVVEATVAGSGTRSSFVRGLLDCLLRLERFFRKTNRDYRRYNYLGEWHSHPSFSLTPSATDDRTMFEIVDDPETHARFAVSLIVKVADNDLDARAYVYYPGGEREDANLLVS
jgi:integrative and conjugative element protein (TIGR02256 family)